MTRYLCAPDSFKESLTAAEAALAMCEGIRAADPEAQVECLPMADGGEGTSQALVDATGGDMRTVEAHDPLMHEIQARYGMLGDGVTAVVETAEASGLGLIEPARRDVLSASSYGTGELIDAAIRAGARTIIVGLGGSATNDAGAGILTALGARLLDADGEEMPLGGAALADVAAIDISALNPAVRGVTFIAACDVTNPLTGPTGASAVFGPQKGATPQDVERLDKALGSFADVLERTFGVDVRDKPGAGAAGGIGGMLMAALHARLEHGIDIVIRYSGLEDAVSRADMVFTGEGSIDAQTRYGKTPAGVAAVAKRHRKPVIAVAGSVGDGIEGLYPCGINAVFGIAPGAATLETLCSGAAANLARTTEQIVRALNLRQW